MMTLFVDGNTNIKNSDLHLCHDGVFLAWVGGLLPSDWLQKGSLEIVSPSVLLQLCGGVGLTGEFRRGR